MGFKSSIITIKNPVQTFEDTFILENLGLSGFSYEGETTLEECIYPNDKSINFAEFNNCFIICDDYQLTNTLEIAKDPTKLSVYETVLTNLFPSSEILTTACHSAVNYHMYSLVNNNCKLRYKKVIAGEPIVQHGSWIDEEQKIYSNSKIINGERLFKSFYEEEENYDSTEDQMMETFTFGVAARHLGVTISTSDDEELMFNVKFRKYSKKYISDIDSPKETRKEKVSWVSRFFK